MGQLGG